MKTVDKIKSIMKTNSKRYSFKIKMDSAQKFDELCKAYGMNKTKLFEKMIDDAISPIHYKGGNMISSRYSRRIVNGILTSF